MDVIWLTKKASRTDSTVQDDNNRSGNDTDADDADIRPIYDEEPMAEVQLTAECNIFAIGQQHTEQPEIINEVLRLENTTDASNKRQQQPDSTSSTSTLATTVTANGNFNFLFPPLSKHLESRSNGWECIENNNVGLSLRSNQNGGIYQGHPELEIAVLSMIGEDVYKENATRLANTGTMHNRIRRRCCAHSSEVGFIPTCSYSSFQSQSFTSSIVDSNLPHHQRKPQSSNKDHQLGRLVRLIITSCHNKLFTSYEMLVRAQVIKKVKIKMIQVKEMMQDNDLKNSKSKDKGSRSRSQSMNEQSHYKQDKTKTRQSINVKSHIFNVISSTEEFEERDLNIRGDC
ncbi:hypothetical protein Tco_0819554 [Tanacetum coccineum]|uniref:Uncharacterized protein n=1 Tax=Tanacetum coccineum TaxID=301880 RepID=A0ABQ5A6X0_9ASTR